MIATTMFVVLVLSSPGQNPRYTVVTEVLPVEGESSLVSCAHAIKVMEDSTKEKVELRCLEVVQHDENGNYIESVKKYPPATTRRMGNST